MCTNNTYRVSSSVRVKQMEAEVEQQIAALRAQIEENGFPGGGGRGGRGGGGGGAGPYNCSSSVAPPKDILSSRLERAHSLRRGLQVAGAVPVWSPADVMQRELQSCLSAEYRPESLPLLLHQFYTDRSSHLAHLKHQLMLRWRRFCRHTSIMEKLYPHYKAQVMHLNQEYEDAVQRARRLSESRETILSGREDAAAIGLVTQDDVLIYLRWLICHLHSVQTLHNFLTVLHYIPAGERKDQEAESKVEETSHEAQHADGFFGLADDVPPHTDRLEEFGAELQSLIAHFHLPYNAENLSSSADQMELFSVVWREFRATFRLQEQMKTFPQYDATDIAESQWGRKSGSTALRKEATWIPFIQVKPRRDPWQQKLVAKLKEEKRVDALLKMHCRLLQVPHLPRVVAALKQHTCHVGDSQSTTSKTRQQKNSEIWTSLYSTATQERQIHSSRSRSSEKERMSASASESLQVLGLDEGLEDSSDPVVTRGAHLSLNFLRHLKLRELQRVSLGLLNYLRSVERTLTFDLAGLQLEDQELRCTAEETSWMNAARGGDGEAGGLGSDQHLHNTPVDYKVRCAEFMQFPDVENLHDFYSWEGRLVHVQDHRGFHVMYDVALRDLQELEEELLLVGSRFTQRNRVGRSSAPEVVDHVAMLLHLWTCEAEFLESKVKLLNWYLEAYQHAAGTEQRFELARVVTDIMHRRPRLDLDQDYFVGAYRAEISCLQSHQQLIRDVLKQQVERQRQYLRRVWRGDDHQPSARDFGLPTNYVPKHLVSLGGSSPAPMEVFLLELHPSLCMAAEVYRGLVQAHAELCQLHRAASAAHRVALQQKLLRRAVQSWKELAPPGGSYSPDTQRELFSDVFLDDPVLVQSAGLTLVEGREVEQGRAGQPHAVQTFCRLLELVTLRHRLQEAASESAHLAQLYKNVAAQLGFDESHLYLRPQQFEVAEQKPVWTSAAMLEDDSSVDRFTPAHLPLSIQELDQNQIGRFSFCSEEAVIHLLNEQSLQNLQVALACQVTHKNALMSAVKLACVCHWAQSRSSSSQLLQGNSSSSSSSSPSRGAPTSSHRRLTEAFVSIQLEKASLRDDMLNSFVKKKGAAGGFIRTPDEAAKIKRELVVDFLSRFSAQTSLHCVRAQIVAYYHSLTSLLDDVPSVRRSHFIIDEPKQALDPGGVELRSCERRPLQLLSEDGQTVERLWCLPDVTCTLRMFRTLRVTERAEALGHTLHIVSALHDVVCYLVSFSKLGNREDASRRKRDPAAGAHLAADWGGPEGVGTELQELQRQVEHLSTPACPRSLAHFLQLRRQVVLLQFDAAVRNLIREAFLSSGDVASYHSVTDNMAAALPLLSDVLQTDVFSLSVCVPPPVQSRSGQAHRLYPWRSFLACHGRLLLSVWDVAPIELCMQLCLSGLSGRSRLQANAAVLGVSLLMEDVLNSGREAEPVRLHGDDNRPPPDEAGRRSADAKEEEQRTGSSSSCGAPPPPAPPPWDPISTQSVLRGFLLLTKQLEVFKENWTRGRFGAGTFRTATLHQQFVKLYRAEIFYPSMRALAQHMGGERDYELLISGSQALLPPAGAPEVLVKTWQLHLLMESAECDMIKALQRTINDQMMLAAAERSRQDAHLPTDVWNKAAVEHRLSPERPQMVHTFLQQLMERAEQTEGEVRVSQDHLQHCVTRLASSVMDRERHSFFFYSQFYEQILQQQKQLLYHKEQDLKSLKDALADAARQQASDSCRELLQEVSELQARAAQQEEARRASEERLALRFKERHDPVVRHLLATCVRLNAGLDEYRLQMERDVAELVSRARAEGVERIIRLKKEFGVTTTDHRLLLTQSQKEEVQQLRLQVGRLSSLLRRLRAANRWRNVVEHQKLHTRLIQSQQVEVATRMEALRVKMVSEEQVLLLQEELQVVRRLLTGAQTEVSSSNKLLSRRTEELQEARHQSAQEARGHQEQDAMRARRLERMRSDVEERERQLQALGEQLDRDGRMNRLQRQRSAKEIRQVREKLQVESSLKQEAFQQVEKLQVQLSDVQTETSRGAAGQSGACYSLSLSRLSTRSPSAVPLRSARRRRLATTNAPQDVPRRAEASGPAGLQLHAADGLFPHLRG